MQREDIRRIVREVLKANGPSGSAGEKPAPGRQVRPSSAPAVLNVFHAGVRKLGQALDQVEQIEKLARRSSVYTVESARSWVCGADVKEKAGTRCILDTVKPDGLERTLLKADILVLPTFCFKTAAKAARLISDDQDSAIVLAALTQGKPTLATKDSFGLCDLLVNDGIRSEIQRILDKLERFGMVLCETERLCETFKEMTSGGAGSHAGKSSEATENKPAMPLTLITAKDIQNAVNNRQRTIELAPGGIVTPLARDQAREYAILIKPSPA